MSLEIIKPNWPAPESVKALVTTREGGVSHAPYDSFNLAMHVGDNSDHVRDNRQQLQQLLQTPHEPQWLQQVHGCRAIAAKTDGSVPEADACYTRQIALPCAVLTADCLPVLFCTLKGDQVAAAHAGWRGLADGVLEATLEQLSVPGEQIMAWLGPAIGPKAFEVGADVRDAFLAFSPDSAQAFVSHPEKQNHWLADLYQLARMRLAKQGVTQVHGGDFCTYTDATRFYSFRRNEQTGRMASLIWIAD